jgi:signal transduction histidine kinase
MSVGRPDPYDRVVTRPAARITGLPRGLAAWIAAQPTRRQERLQDAGLAVALAAANAATVLPYRAQLHPFWLALSLVVLQALPLAVRRARPVGAGFVIAAARVGYDRLGFGFAPFPLAPAIAFYTIIERRGLVWRTIALVLVAVGLTLSQLTPGHSEPYDAIFQVVIFLTAWVAGMVSRAKRASLRAAQTRADQAEAQLDAEAARAAEVERGRIARELHDVVAHHVSLIAVQAEAAASLLPGQPERASRSVEIISDTARQALAELRRLLGVLREPESTEPSPAVGPMTTPVASLTDLDAVIDQVREAGLPVELRRLGTPFALAPGIELTAYRIVQEALTNTLRHAATASAEVTLSYEPGFLCIDVTDSGPRQGGGRHGEARRLSRSAGYGLAGIAERVASCGGSLRVGPVNGQGFVVAAKLPSA